MPAPIPATTLQHLIDRAAISDLIFSYATGIDRRDWALYRSIFTERVAFDFTTWSGMKEEMAVDDWVASVKATLACFDATQHTMSNHVIALDGDRATITVHMTALHAFDGETQTLGGFYTNGLVRTAAGWRIASCCLVITWEQGDRALFDRAAARGPKARIDVGEQGI